MVSLLCVPENSSCREMPHWMQAMVST